MRVALLLLVVLTFAVPEDADQLNTADSLHLLNSLQRKESKTDAKSAQSGDEVTAQSLEALATVCDPLTKNRKEQLKFEETTQKCGAINNFASDVCRHFKDTPLANNDCDDCIAGSNKESNGADRCNGPYGPTEPTDNFYCGEGEGRGIKRPDGTCCTTEECKKCLPPTDAAEVSVGQTSSTGTWDPATLRVDCHYAGTWDSMGMQACHAGINMITMVWPHQMEQYRCYVGPPQNGQYANPGNPAGKCDCQYPMYLANDARCHTFTCQAGTSGPVCRTCVSPLTRNNECSSCNDGYILDNGDCLSVTCTEDPDDWEWQGCQECRVLESRRHPEDCLTCAHGYHHLNEQRHVPNATDTVVYSSGSLVVAGQETGYCFPYTCVAGGNLVNANSRDGDFGPPPKIPMSPYQRAVKITKIVSTDKNNLDPSVPALDDYTLTFRDHCRTCVPQQKRIKDDHCETCNSGYYLDEMHHTCRKKTCGVPHFRRNAVSCTEEHLEPKPWSTPCTTCKDNSIGDDDACCVKVPPVMTCGAQNVFCEMGTYKDNYQTADCSSDDCVHFSDNCCNAKTCANQDVACFKHQDVIADYPLCTDCSMGSKDCCTDKPTTCGLQNVKCGPTQHHLGSDTPCTDCLNEGVECCTPMQKTCQNQGVVCEMGTFKDRTDVAAPVVCKDCEHYGEECCDEPTCLNQRVACAVGRVHKGDVVCDDCIHNTEECCEPLPPVQDTCGNQKVKCEPRLYKPAGTNCETKDKTCDDYGETCCVAKTCGNQEVGCSPIQAALASTTACVNCADNGDECCTADKTCGLVGTQCKLGGYLPPMTKCKDCEHFGDECCVVVAKTCTNQGVVCLPGTHMPLGTACTDCKHYGTGCCEPTTCGNQKIGCSMGRPRKGDDAECGAECYHDSDKCCEPLVKTCAAMNVKCDDGHYNDANQVCDDKCTNYAAPCCVPFQKTCGNQNVVCNGDQTYEKPGKACNDCVNHGGECCVEVEKTCANQDVVCRPGHYVEDYQKTSCDSGNCQNDALPCCKPYVKTCGSEDVVCSAGQTYNVPSTTCTTCTNHGSECCVDIPKTCANQNVVCRSGHYADDYASKKCEGCLNDDTAECCVAFVTTCGNQNVKCNKNQVPVDPQTVCDGLGECKNNSETCCVDVAETCGNQSVVCRPGHYVSGYKDMKCGSQGCLNDAQPCCVDFKATCGNQNIKCHSQQTYKGHETLCDGSCVNYGGTCCEDVPQTCGNQGAICRPGYYAEGFKSVACEEGGCHHHDAPCCSEYKKTCGNQNVVCSAGQTFNKPSTVCDKCENRGSECCVDIAQTCSNQRVVCRPGHYADDYSGKACEGCVNGATECCKPFVSTCGNQNVKCGKHFTPVNHDVPCDGEECHNDSATCCTPVDATCSNQSVVCRPGHYVKDYATAKCAEAGCLNDQAPCCEAFVKTCQNQGVVCTLDLMKNVDGGETVCVDCNNYDTKECCEEITKTCGNSGQMCRQDLYKPVDTPCTNCGVDECCDPIPPPVPTCANQLYLCKSMYYKPHDTPCPDGKCDDATCCHHIPPTCANQNVQCHPGTHKAMGTGCENCNHYGSECCEERTCETVGVTCDTRTLVKAAEYNTMTCEGKEGCVLENNSAPCCVDKKAQAQAPTCDNKYGIDDGDRIDYPFLIHLDGMIPVNCDVSKGWYPRLGADGKPGADKTPCGVKLGNADNMWSACQDNDQVCCWRKTCKQQNSVANGMNNGGEGNVQDGGTVVCAEGYKMKANPEYIVCQGDCQADCCDKIPEPETCHSERVACSYGFRRLATWSSAQCGYNCVENSAACCEPTTCDTEEVTCNEDQNYITGANCFRCVNGGSECCKQKVIKDTCSNQRVHCGYGHFKVADFEDKLCDDCYENGSECCVKKTCGNRGVNDATKCSAPGFAAKDASTSCYLCKDDGAECCDVVPPAKTCSNQDVACGLGLVYKDLDTKCTDCLDNGSECCTHRTCGDTGEGKAATCGDGLDANSPDTKCTLCMDDHDECCTKQETCWTSKVVCEADTYHKHPNLICGDSCSQETCCAKKTCENQGVCCNKNLGFSEVAGFADQSCSGCADNCEECCSYDTPTCSSAMVGCGFGYHRQKKVEDVACSTCALNDPKCCTPRTCGADLDIDEAYNCGDDYKFLGNEVKCHFCGKDECCKPIAPPPTCKSANINCGVGMKRVDGSDDTPCKSCVQNDDACCAPKKCNAEATCPTGSENKGDVLCALCTEEECCDETPTCENSLVGCGFGFKHTDDQTVQCTSCQLNDSACCVQKTCASEAFPCPGGFQAVSNMEKKCSFCELSECCEPIIPTKTCKSESVACGHGYHKLDGSDEAACGVCEMNNKACCGESQCTAETCPSGYHRKETNLQCGFCSVEECCLPDVPPKTCASEKVGCGFGWKALDQDRTKALCSTCAHNDPNCCEQKMCKDDGPTCSAHKKDGQEYTAVGLTTTCTTCGLDECCVPPVIPATCVNQDVICSGQYDKQPDFMTMKCDDCVHNGDECCVQRTCAGLDVSCNSDLFAAVSDYDTRTCVTCEHNGRECCEPKLCGSHFADKDGSCDAETSDAKARNQPCVNCDTSECCTPKPTLKCAEIIIPHGQAFYSKPAGKGTERTKGSILSVECDLGYKFQDSEYYPSADENSRNQDVSVVDYPICFPELIESWIEGHVEVFSPTTSGWNRAPPVCRPVTCPPLKVQSKFTPDAPTKWDIGTMLYVDAQMDQVPMRGAGYGPRDYAGEADVVCNEGWIRVPNVCANEQKDAGQDEHTENTLEYALKGFWRFENNLDDSSPHCVDSKSDRGGTCNLGKMEGAAAKYSTDGPEINGKASNTMVFNGKDQYVRVDDDDNNYKPWNGNELNIDSDQWTASVWAKLSNDLTDNDAFLFARFTEGFDEIVSIRLSNGFLCAVYNDGPLICAEDGKLPLGKWINIIVRMDGEKINIFIDGALKKSQEEDDSIADTENGHVFIGADQDPKSGVIEGFFTGELDEVRYYTRGISDEEVQCIANGKTTCSAAAYYAKPYNTQGCNRPSEEIQTAEECRQAINELLQDSILGNSLNGGKRFGRTIQDDQKAASYDNVPAKCSYREEDAQIIFNPAANGQAHTSLSPICKTNPTGDDLQTLGCLPKCLSNGKWSVEAPTCEKDWCHPIFEEWSCCENRLEQKSQKYWLDYHDQEKPLCPVNYGDCDNDSDCSKEHHRGLCSQNRDLDNIDVCIVDLDPCNGVVGATGPLCVVMTAVGMDYHAHAESGLASNLFLGGSVLALGSLVGYYLMRENKGDEHRALLEEEL